MSETLSEELLHEMARSPGEFGEGQLAINILESQEAFRASVGLVVSAHNDQGWMYSPRARLSFRPLLKEQRAVDIAKQIYGELDGSKDYFHVLVNDRPLFLANCPSNIARSEGREYTYMPNVLQLIRPEQVVSEDSLRTTRKTR